jgi:hypothetical protein
MGSFTNCATFAASLAVPFKAHSYEGFPPNFYSSCIALARIGILSASPSSAS